MGSLARILFRADIGCLFDTVAGNPNTGSKPMPPALLVKAFEASFGTCPQIPACPAPCHPPVAGAYAGAVFGTNFV